MHRPASTCALLLTLGVTLAIKYDLEPAVERLDLGGADWQFWNGNHSLAGPATVPGQIHMDLLQNKLIQDPYWRFQVDELRWITAESWTYSRTFDIKESQLQRAAAFLVTEGLDTIAAVYVNSHLVLENDNMFHTQTTNVRTALVAGSNNITIVFSSAPAYAENMFHACNEATSGFCPDVCPPDVQDGICYVDYIRKEPCSFSWDWGPAFAPAGIWRDIYIQFFDEITLDAVTIIPTTTDNSHWTADVVVFVNSGGSVQDGTLEVSVAGTQASVPVALKKGEQKVSLHLAGIRADPWWPNGHGKQPMYELKATYTASTGATTELKRMTGFRTVQITQRPLGGEGYTMEFTVNGKAIFMKGANWIPADAFEQRVTRDQLDMLFRSYVEAHYTMIRNWGGGVYQQDAFYELADQYGLMVWEEFMFACNDYAVPKSFLDSVAKEVADNVKRLQHHPSIALWSGNNENEGRYTPDDPRVKFYGELYFGTVLGTVLTIDTSRSMLGSSPSNANETAEHPVDWNPQSDVRGDRHYYNYDADCWDVTTYPWPRFASEFGVQSWPSFETMKLTTEAQDWSYNSSLMQNRNHHPDGQEQMTMQIERHYRMPNVKDKVKQYEFMLWMTQVNQAYCIKMEAEHYRRLRSQCLETGGCTMGSLYWQANDIWPGASWASIDYYGRWKLLHYFAKQFYAPVLASAVSTNSSSFEVFVVSDVPAPITVNVNFTMISWRQGPLHTWTVNTHLDSLDTNVIVRGDVKSILQKGHCSNELDCVLVWDVYDHDSHERLSSNFYLLASPKDVKTFQKPNLRVKSVAEASGAHDGKSFVVTIEGDAPAPFTWLETGEFGHFEDNGFVYRGSGPVEVKFAAEKFISTKTLQDSLRVWALTDVTE